MSFKDIFFSSDGHWPVEHNRLCNCDAGHCEEHFCNCLELGPAVKMEKSLFSNLESGLVAILLRGELTVCAILVEGRFP